MEAGDHYRSQRRAATELYRGLDEQRLAAAVPGCPQWTVRDALGHMVGLPADVAAGVMAGAGSPAWTGKQVSDRASASVEDLLAEWEQTAPPFEASLAGLGTIGWIFVMDLTMHLDDVREALGLPLGALVLDRLVDQAEKRAAGVGTLVLHSEGNQGRIGAGEPVAELRIDDRGEMARVFGGRRTDDQVRALDWTGDPEPWLPVLPLFREGR